MNRALYFIRFQLPGLALLLGSSMLVVSCSVTGPDESPWQDVRTFSWPTTTGSTMMYKIDQINVKADTADVITRAGTLTYQGQPMFMLHRTLRSNGAPESAPIRFHFLPLNQDTLVTENDGGVGAKFALVAPLEKGHQWVATYDERAPDSAKVTATIVERYSYWKLEGKGYKNVVAVKYEDVTKPREEWIRFYAEGIGEILTVRNVYPVSSFPNDNVAPRADQRITLIERSAAP